MRPDTEHQDNIVCPYCGHENRDSWEVEGDAGETECGDCGREFTYERHTTITYSTRREDCGAHVWGKVGCHDIDADRIAARTPAMARALGEQSPHRLWYRQCVQCDEQTFAHTPLGGACPWPTTEEAV